MLVFLRSNEIIDQQIDQHKPQDRWVTLGRIGKIAGIKKTLDALFIRGLIGMWVELGKGGKTNIL